MVLFYPENVQKICILYKNNAILITRRYVFDKDINTKDFFVKDNEMLIAVFYENGKMEMFSISKEEIEEYEEMVSRWVISKEDLVNNIREFAPRSGFNITSDIEKFYVYDIDDILWTRNLLC
jgi:antitoxin component YwqK of YwqJK toxin-antitoxin module